MRTCKYKLKLTKAQSARVESWIGTCRYVYNLALETKINAYQSAGFNLSKFDLMKQLTDVRAEKDWISDVPCGVQQNVLEGLESAYQKFFKGSGFPKFAKKGEYNSIRFKLAKSTKCGFKLPKLGNVRVFKDRHVKGKIKTATIVKERNQYFICIAAEVESENLYPTNENQVVGIDMGIAYFLVDSDGCFVENPRVFKKYEAQLRIENRSLARKKKGSKSRQKQKERLSKLHLKISNVRKDFLHKTSIKYIKENSLIVAEKLVVKNMIKFGNLSKSISDASWSSFFLMLKYKSKLYEKTFVQINPAYTSQKCSCCGHVAKENRLSQSKFECVECGHQQNADLNAAQNILREGIAQNRQREALACA